jgi:hypothetical protein
MPLMVISGASPFLALCFLFTMRWRSLSAISSHYHYVLPKCMGPSVHGLNPLKSWAKVNPSFFKLPVSGISVTVMRKVSHTVAYQVKHSLCRHWWLIFTVNLIGFINTSKTSKAYFWVCLWGFSETIKWRGKTCPECGQHHLIG